MTEELCDVMEIPKNGCAHCTGRDGGESEEKARLKRLLTMRHVFPARYPGQCAQCGEHFEEGHPITGIGEGRYISACCIADDGSRRAAG